MGPGFDFVCAVWTYAAERSKEAAPRPSGIEAFAVHGGLQLRTAVYQAIRRWTRDERRRLRGRTWTLDPPT